MKKQLIITTLTASLAWMCLTVAAQTNPPQITSLISTQRAGTYFVDINYNLIDPDNQGAYILVECSQDSGGTYGVPIYSLTGDAGVLVPPGNGKHIVWNAFNDWANNYTTNAKIRLTADASFKGVFLATTNPPPATNLVYVPSGSFAMTCGPNVYISRGFWMGRFEVRQGEYVAIMTNNPSSFTNSSNLPVDSVTWNEAVLYCQRLNTREQAAGRLPAGWSYRLPTEAEWEYAARAGTTTTFYFGANSTANRLPYYAWYNFNAGSTTHDVGGRAPNRWGLYDMYGNVREWCSDWWIQLPDGNVTDPQGPASGTYRTMRGSGFKDAYWGSLRQSCYYYNNASNVAADGDTPATRSSSIGFRVVLAPNP